MARDFIPTPVQSSPATLYVTAKNQYYWISIHKDYIVTLIRPPRRSIIDYPSSHIFSHSNEYSIFCCPVG